MAGHGPPRGRAGGITVPNLREARPSDRIGSETREGLPTGWIQQHCRIQKMKMKRKSVNIGMRWKRCGRRSHSDLTDKLTDTQRCKILKPMEMRSLRRIKSRKSQDILI